MSDQNYDELGPRKWEQDQLVQSDTPEHVKIFVNSLLDVYWSHVTAKPTTLEDKVKVLSIFSSLAQGHALVVDDPDAVWVPARRGALVVRDRVRVRADAYDGRDGVFHNSREGVIVAIRSGNIHVRYSDDLEPSFGFVKHEPHALEKRIR